jgi:hypothetical protein
MALRRKGFISHDYAASFAKAQKRIRNATQPTVLLVERRHESTQLRSVFDCLVPPPKEAQSDKRN